MKNINIIVKVTVQAALSDVNKNVKILSNVALLIVPAIKKCAKGCKKCIKYISEKLYQIHLPKINDT
jgi:hypothetical protein